MGNVTSFRVADLPQNAPTPFELRPASAALDEIRQGLGLLGLRGLQLLDAAVSYGPEHACVQRQRHVRPSRRRPRLVDGLRRPQR